MNNIPIFSIDLYKFQIRHIENINVKNILTFKTKNHVIIEVIHWYRASLRKACPKALSKGEVHGTGKKPFAQKGRGVARQGSLKNPHQRGGGVAFPPNKRTYAYKMNKKKKYIALQSIFITRLKENRIKIINKMELDSPSSKIIDTLLKNLQLRKVLFIDCKNANLQLSTQNVKKTKFITFDKVNAFDFVSFPSILITKYAFSKLLLLFFPNLLRSMRK